MPFAKWILAHVENVQSSIYECIVDEIDAEKVILKTEIENLDIIPSHIDGVF